ncbi:MAG TPA: ABC transporter ATP-binding protein [Elusimicrobiota bacterium]|nr:ABC transporter ATP-binding protein [Elusimicrobiota bacterium]
MPSLTVSRITKSFTTGKTVKTVLSDVSFDVPEGETLCLLGPNGSGKTTLLKIVSSLLIPDAGSVAIDGRDVLADILGTKRTLGFGSSEDHSFYGRLTVEQNLRFYSDLHGLSRADRERRMGEMADILEIGAILKTPFRELSSGQKQRLLIVRALLHDPRIVLLDEPTQNLDPNFSARLREYLTSLSRPPRPKTFLISTHHLDDAQKFSDRWVILSKGSVRFSGSVSTELRRNPGMTVDDLFRKSTEAVVPC